MTAPTFPRSRWAFDARVTDVFDDMLERSIPQYHVMREAVLDLGTTFVQDGTDIVDLGSSRGAALAPLVDRFGALARYHAVETAEPMLAVLRERFTGLVDQRLLFVHATDLRRAYPKVRSSLTQAVLTLQFVPIEYRQRVLRDVFNSTLPGGAFILVEKILGRTEDVDRLMVDRYYAFKAKNGYTPDEIAAKREALEGVLVPVHAETNERLLRDAGFTRVECFWRWMNFAAWVAVR